MISFAFSGYGAFAGNNTRGEFTVFRFPDQELAITVEATVEDQPCEIIGTIAPPDESLLATTLLADTLRRDGAQNIVAYLPYLAYSRQDQNNTGTSRGMAWAGQQLLNAGVEKIVTIDVHSQQTIAQCPIPIASLSPAALLAEKVRQHISLDDLTVIAPDQGAVQRATDLAQQLSLSTPIAMDKHRTDGLEHLSLPDVPTSRALIIDDILDTGRTLISCCRHLQEQGILEIYIVVTHGLFTGEEWQNLWQLGVKQIFVGNTVPLANTPLEDYPVVVCDLSSLQL